MLGGWCQWWRLNFHDSQNILTNQLYSCTQLELGAQLSSAHWAPLVQFHLLNLSSSSSPDTILYDYERTELALLAAATVVSNSE